jgi:hypothetical protein
MRFPLIMQWHIKKSFTTVSNVTVWRVLREILHLMTYKLSIVQHLKDGTFVCLLSVNVFVTLFTLTFGEYHCKAASETPFISCMKPPVTQT